MRQFRSFLALDPGSSTIKVAIAEIRDGRKTSIARMFAVPSSGIRKGGVDDLVGAVRSMNNVFHEVRRTHPDAIKQIFLGLGSPTIKVQPSKGIVAVSRADYKIYTDDIDRVTQASQAVNLLPNRMVVHSLIKEFVVDGIEDIKDPLGMVGNRLELNSLIIDVFSPALKNLEKCVEMSGGRIAGIVLNTLASSRAVLSQSQKELGVAVVDIGFGTTGLAVYEEGKLVHTAIIPIGSGHITNDLAIGLKISIEAADTIKLTLGHALAKEVSSREMVDLRKIDQKFKNSVSRHYIAEIIEVRLAEIFEFVHNELKAIRKGGELPAGVVLAGGGAKLEGIVELARQELRLPASPASINTSPLVVGGSDVEAQIEDPEFACAAGLLLFGHDGLVTGGDGLSMKAPLTIIKKLLSYFTP